MDRSVLEACSHGSMAGTMRFPETIERLRASGVQRYHTDLVSLRKSYYGTDDTAADVALPLTDPPVIADTFSSEAVNGALREIQQGAILYPEFLRRIMAGGTVAYTVCLDSRKTLYVGRHGDHLVEPFPTPR